MNKNINKPYSNSPFAFLNDNYPLDLFYTKVTRGTHSFFLLFFIFYFFNNLITITKYIHTKLTIYNTLGRILCLELNFLAPWQRDVTL